MKNPLGKDRESCEILNKKYIIHVRPVASVSLSLQDEISKEMEDETFACLGKFHNI